MPKKKGKGKKSGKKGKGWILFIKNYNIIIIE